MSTKKIFTIFGLIVILAMLLSACGASPPSPGRYPAPAATEAPAATKPRPPAAGGR